MIHNESQVTPAVQKLKTLILYWKYIYLIIHMIANDYWLTQNIVIVRQIVGQRHMAIVKDLI